MGKRLYPQSPTSIEADWRCQREYWWLTRYGGRGIKPLGVNEDLEVGTRLHLGMEAYFKGGIEAALEAIRQPGVVLVDPWQTWLEASLMGWDRVWKVRKLGFEVVAVEQRLEWGEEGVTFVVKPDLILRGKDGLLWVYDWKSFRTWDEKKWVRNPQLQLGMVGCEKVGLGVCGGGIIQGIYKGERRGERFYHPLAFAYRRVSEKGTSYAYTYKRDYEHVEAVQVPGGVRGWVKAAPAEVLANVLPCSAPIMKRERMLRGLVEQRVESEKRREGMDVLGFPQNFNGCESKWGRCSYFAACHSEVVGRDPVGSGEYRWRGEHGEGTEGENK